MKPAFARSCIAGLLIWATCAISAAGDIYVIANSGVKIGAHEVRDIFLGVKQFADSVKLTPLENTSAQAEFLSKVVRMEAGKYSTAWIKKGFREGLTAPAAKSSDAEVIEFVKRTPGAVGYTTVVPDGVNVIGKF